MMTAKPGPVRDGGVEGRHLVFEAVAFPAARATRRRKRAAASRDVVVGEGMPAHIDVGARIVIFGIVRERAGPRSISVPMSPAAIWSVTGTAPTPENQRSQIWAIMSVTPAAV